MSMIISVLSWIHPMILTSNLILCSNQPANVMVMLWSVIIIIVPSKCGMCVCVRACVRV